MTVERRLALAIQLCVERGLCPRDTLTYLLSLWIGRLTYYFGPTEFLVDDAEFKDGDSVAIYFKPVDNPNDDPYVIHRSISRWLDWSEGRDQYLTQAYGSQI